LTKKSLEALKGSIKKWTGIIKRTEIDRGPSNCPLCQLFWNNDGNCCRGCPVYAKTHTLYCNGTPHETWADHHESVHEDYGEASIVECDTCVDHAEAELDFLKSLLPKKKKVKK